LLQLVEHRVEHLQARARRHHLLERLDAFLGQLDVLPVDDFGVREGFRFAYRRRTRPTPKALQAYGERWKPFRSVAAWYLWRAAGESRRAVKPRP